MLSFQPLSIGDKKTVDAVSAVENSRSADFVFGNMFLWNDKYRQSICISEGRLYVRAEGEHVPIFPFPIGNGDLGEAIEKLLAYTREQGYSLVLRGVELHHKEQLEALFPGRFSFVHDRDYDDYIYSAEKLATLAGKKLHGKRNHINRFEATYPNCHFEPLRKEHFPLCRELLDLWEKEVNDGEHLVGNERQAIELAFENFEALSLMGGVLFVGEKLVAFTLGEVISSDCFNVHFEKADADTEGAYPMINREFVRYILKEYPHISYVNREDDMGLDNLRKSKLSYRPEIILEKYSAHWMD
ncbi:MAG: DUF2156 domain-containing protein [Oscillospiraceae bacterium]|nr:DUF2156 domain-containing protein [Oscillospiraceae bacterium]